MPRVRTSQRQVQEQVVNQPDFNVQFRSSGGQELQAAGEILSNSVAPIIEKQRKRALDTQMTNIESRVLKRSNELMHSQDEGFKNLSGRDTVDQFDGQIKKYDDYSQSILTETNDPEAKELAQSLINQQRERLRNNMNQHTNSEMRVYRASEFKNYVNNMIDDAVLSKDESVIVDGKRVPKARANINALKTRIAQFGDDEGMGPEEIKSRQLDATSRVHENLIVDVIEDGRSLTAAEMLVEAKKKKEVDAPTISKLERMLSRGKVKDQSFLFADQVLSKTKPDGSPLSQPEALKEARDLARKQGVDPEIVDATVRRIKTRFKEDEDATKQAQDATYEDIVNNIERYGGDYDVPPAQWTALPAKYKKSVRALIDKGPVNDDDLSYNLFQMASADNTKETFAKMDLNEFRHQLSKQNFNSLRSAQKKIIKDESLDIEELQSFTQSNTIVRNLLKRAEIDDEKEASLFYARLKKEEDIWKRQNNQPSVPKEVSEQIANGLMIEVVTEEGFIFDTKKKLFQLNEEEKLRLQSAPREQQRAIGIDEIPKKDVEEIKKALSAAGEPINDQLIIELYRQGLEVDNG